MSYDSLESWDQKDAKSSMIPCRTDQRQCCIIVLRLRCCRLTWTSLRLQDSLVMDKQTFQIWEGILKSQSCSVTDHPKSGRPRITTMYELSCRTTSDLHQQLQLSLQGTNLPTSVLMQWVKHVRQNLRVQRPVRGPVLGSNFRRHRRLRSYSG